MKKSKFTEEQIAFALRMAETGTRVAEVCRKFRIIEQTFYRWNETSDAYEACLKSRFYTYKLTPESIHQSLEYYRLALEKDPNCALACTGISFSWLLLGLYGIVMPREASSKSKDAALKAIILDDSLGRHKEALAEITRALELDPLNPLSQAILGGHFLFTRQYEEAIAQYRKILKAEPSNTMVLNGLWSAFHLKGKQKEAFQEMTKYFSALEDNEAVEILDTGYAEGGYLKAMHHLADLLA